MSSRHDTFRTPFGEFSVAVNPAGEILGTAFGNTSALRRRLRSIDLRSSRTTLHAARSAVLAYCEGETHAFTLPLSPRGTPFQLQVWTALQCIPFGETRSYGQLAAALGNPAASRAVGRANATNPICLLVPCHRVIGSNGSLTGFAFGETLKRRLLEHEQVGRIIPNAPLRAKPAA
jgi:methylated-DNA-[protein]-cysteine S-methyltransferase